MKIFGINPVLEALRSDPRRVERILVVRGRSQPRLREVISLARDAGVQVRQEPEQAVNRAASDSGHQGIVAFLSEAPLTTMEEVLQDNPQLLLLPDGVEDPRNLGAVLRTAEAAGVDGVLLPDRRSCGLTGTVVKASAGAALHLPIALVGNVAQSLGQLKNRGYWIVGLDMDGDQDIRSLDCSGPLAIVVGGEHRGLRTLVRRQCDFVVSLPMKGKVQSLNLSVATGVLLYQVVANRAAGVTRKT